MKLKLSAHISSLLKLIKITNYCAVTHVGCRLKLNQIMRNDIHQFSSKRYNPKQKPHAFSGLIAKYKNTKLTLLIFYNGKIIMTGGKSEEQLLACINDVITIFDGAYLKSFRINNICASLNINDKINLIQLAQAYPMLCSYEPELYPGIIMRHLDKKFTIHWTGKIFTTGHQSQQKIIKYFKQILKKIVLFIKT